MIVTPSPKSVPSMALQVLTYLRPRMNLSGEQTLNFTNLTKGYEGERKLNDLLKEHLSSNYLVLNDLLLQSNHSEFQIDTLIIGKQKIYPLEVKNYEGDFYVENDKWYVAHTKQEIRNPLTQLQRSEFLLRHLLRKSYPNLSIKTCIIFINKTFTLYQAPLGLPAIFPTQLTRFIENISSKRSGRSQQITDIANHLASIHVTTSSYEKLPVYNYDELRKGLMCNVACGGILENYSKRTFICPTCQQTKNIHHAIYQNIKEFHLLFPEREITTGIIHDWCNFVVSRPSIRNVLKMYLKPITKGKYTHYVTTTKKGN